MYPTFPFTSDLIPPNSWNSRKNTLSSPSQEVRVFSGGEAQPETWQPVGGNREVTLREMDNLLLFFFFLIYFFIFGCVGSSLLCAGFSLVAASGGYSSLRCTGFSMWWLLLLQSTGSRHAGFSSCGSRAQ